jgi:hypothetical protein
MVLGAVSALRHAKIKDDSASKLPIKLAAV